MDDLNKINYLIDKSMFWSLETHEPKRMILDADAYLYEGRQTVDKKWDDAYKKDYHLVIRYAQRNFDFVNLGQFLMYKAGLPNNYKDK